MSAKEFFHKYSLEEINIKTKISPITLKQIKNKNFEKIPRVKFIGFVRIMEKEFNVDLSDLIEEYNEFYNQNRPEEEYKPKKSNNLSLILIALCLVGGGVYLLKDKFSTTNPTSNVISTNSKETNETAKKENKTNTISITDKNQTASTLPAKTKPPKIVNETKNKETNTTKTLHQPPQKPSSKPIQKQQIVTIPQKIVIIPNKKLWFFAKNLDTNKSVQFLTSEPKTLKGPNWYLKLGHGFVSIKYGKEIITPNTKKIVKITFKNGKVIFPKNGTAK